MSRPPVLTSLCCKLVRDQFLILCGNASRRHRFPRLLATTRSHRRASLDRNRWQLSRVIFTACLPSLIYCSAVPCLRALLRRGKSQAECATILGVSLRTIGRLVAG